MTTIDPSATGTHTSLATKRRRRWPFRLTLVLATLIFLVGDLLGAGTLLIRGALPQTAGVIHVAGAHGAITITRDQSGVPHINAADAHDLFFAQGYVTAQDRLWQMEFNRRVAAGRLAEILGPSALTADRFLRTVGLARSAQTDVADLRPDLHAQLDAYTAGVNAFLTSHKDNLPLEFRLLGFTPEPWQDTDSIAYGKVVALDLDGAWNVKLARAKVLAQVGPTITSLLFPSYPTDNPTLIDATGTTANPLNSEAPVPVGPDTNTDSGLLTPPSGGNPLAAISPTQRAAFAHMPTSALATVTWLRQLLDHDGGTQGSNDWVISGAHTTTGKPIVANDPHLGINYPAIWYEVALQAGDINEIGFSFPGVPGIIIGHNAHVAWGVTNGEVDDTDLYIEQLNADQTAYTYNGQQMPLQILHETIKVAGKPADHLTVRITNHGPILNDVVSDLKDSTTQIALQWTALQPSYTFAGFFELGLAHNLDEFQNAIRDIGISQNFVFADTDGNIGYRLSGWLPERAAINGLLPVDGSTSANDWTGRVPFEQMPHLLNPSTGIILTANNRLTAPGYPFYITNSYDSGYRAKRIEQLLTVQSTLSPDDVAHAQSDVHSIPAEQLLPYYLNAANDDPTSSGAQTAASLFNGWDADMTRASAPAALYEVTTGMLIRDVIKPVLGAKAYDAWDNNQYASTKFVVLRDALTFAQSPFFSSTIDRDIKVRLAEQEAYTFLKQHFGTSDTSKWHWGDLHQAHFDHPLTAVPALRALLPNQAVTRPGDSTTVNVGGSGKFDQGDYDQLSLPSMREIIDLGNFDNSRFVTTTGESGVPFAPHNFDLLPLWNAGQYQPMDFSPAAVKAHAAATLTLEP